MGRRDDRQAARWAGGKPGRQLDRQTGRWENGKKAKQTNVLKEI